MPYRFLKAFFIISLLSFPIHLTGQSTFTRNVSNGLNGIHGGAMAVAGNGDYFFNAAINTDNLMVMRTNADGLKIYEKLIAPLPFNNVGEVAEKPNGDFFLYAKNDLTFSNVPVATIKIDANGNPLTIKQFYINTNAKINVSVTGVTGSLFFGGSVYDGSGTDTDMLLIKMDGNANFLWARSINMPGSQAITSVSPTSVGGCIIIGSDTSGLNRYVLRFSSSGTLAWSREFLPFNNDLIRPMKFHETDSGTNILTANLYTLLPNEQLIASLILELNNAGYPINTKGFKNINGVSSLFSKNHWFYQDPNYELRLHGCADFYNASVNTYYSAPYYLKMNLQFDIISSKCTPLFNSETSITKMVRTGADEFVQVLDIKDHYTSFPFIEEATSYRKFNVVTNGCINTSPALVSDTAFTMTTYATFSAPLISHTFTDSSFNLLPSISSNYSIFGCTPTSTSESITDIIATVHPNPATTNLKVDFHNTGNDKCNFQVYSTTGMLVLRGELINGNIDISNLPPQVYLLKLISDSQTGNVVFVKMEGR